MICELASRVVTTPTDQDFGLVSAAIRYRQNGPLRRAAQIETAAGLVRIRTGDGVQLLAPIAELSEVHGSWWSPGGFSLVVSGQRHRMAASIRGGPDDNSSVWFTNVDVIDLLLLMIYVVVSPLLVVYLVRTRRRWVKILHGTIDVARLAEAARARSASKDAPPGATV